MRREIVARTEINTTVMCPQLFYCAAKIACDQHSNDIQRNERAGHTRMEGTPAHATGR